MMIRFKNRLRTLDKGVRGETGYVSGQIQWVVFEGELLSWGQGGDSGEIWPVAIIMVKSSHPNRKEEFNEAELNQAIRTAPVEDIYQVLSL